MNRIQEFIEDNVFKVLIGLAVAIVLLLLISASLVFGQKKTVSNQDDFHQGSTLQGKTSETTSLASSGSGSNNSSTQNTNGTDQQIFVDVKGAVKNPGVYQVTSNMRVCDAVDLAGGFTNSADKKHVDLAAKLSDQQVLYVPLRGEIKSKIIGSVPQQSGSNQSHSDASSQEQSGNANNSSKQGINLNSADKNQLQQLSGIGEKKAAQIISYRQSHGKFKSIEELKNVPGFGDKTFANLKSSICV